MRKASTLMFGLLGVAALAAGAAGAACGGSDSGSETGAGGGGTGDPQQPGSDSGPTTDGSVTTDRDTGVTSPTDSGGGDGSKPIVDAGGDARPEPSCAGLAYCEDFESYPGSSVAISTNTTIGPWKATVNGAAVMTIDGVRPYGGAKALHITVPKNDTGASGLLNLTKAAGLITGNNLFGRAMVYYTKSATDDKPIGVHSWIFQGIGTSTASGKIMSLNLANNGTSYFLNYHGDSTSSAESSKNGGTPVAAKWVCMQWEYDSSGASPADEAKVWADGTLIIDATKAAQNWNLATPFSTMQFGFTHYQTLPNAIDVYLDDFAVNNAMVACPP